MRVTHDADYYNKSKKQVDITISKNQALQILLYLV